MFEIPTPTEEQIEAGRRARAEIRAQGSDGTRFTPVNLGHWVNLCRETGVPFVPTYELARIPVEDLLNFDAQPAPETLRPFFEKVLLEMAANHSRDWMVRWSCCACEDVKYRMHMGRHEWHQDVATLRIDDMRAYDLISEYPEETIAAYARPWMKAAIHETHPVEYRVFVMDNTVQGISNYYPQRALPNDAQTLQDITLCVAYAHKLIQAQTKRLHMPELDHPDSGCDLTKNHWTADFMRLDEGRIVFLEGGPPHTPRWGAHPCCFALGEMPSGIALAARDTDREAMGIFQME